MPDVVLREVRARSRGVWAYPINEVIIVDFGANRALLPSDVERHRGVFAAADVVISQLEIPPETAAAAMRIGRESGVITILNPEPLRPIGDDAWEKIDIVTPNEIEARMIVGQSAGEPDSHEEVAKQIVEKGVGSVVMTLDERGAYVCSSSFTGMVPGRSVDTVDTTGAGDAFAAPIATAPAEGATLRGATALSLSAR